MKDKNSFILYKSFYPPISFLTLEQKGKLFDAIFRYQIEGITEVDDDIKMPFLFFINQFKIDEDKYDKVREKRRAAGKAGNHKRWGEKIESQKEIIIANATNASKCEQKSQNIANITDNDNVNDNVNDNSNNTVSFDTFWNLYDKKVDRSKCEKKWSRLSENDKKAAIAYIPKYKEAQPDKQYRRNPETFLNNRSWENEIIFREEEQGINTGKIQKDGFGWNM